MKRATFDPPNDPRKRIGSAIWLLLLLLRHTPPDWNGGTSAWVAGGNVISDAELAERLSISIAVAVRWRRKLRRLGLVGWLVSSDRDRAFWVAAGIGQAFESQAPQEQSVASQGIPAVGARAVVWKALQERSIALTGKVVEDLNAAESIRLADALAEGSKNPCESAPSGS